MGRTPAVLAATLFAFAVGLLVATAGCERATSNEVAAPAPEPSPPPVDPNRTLALMPVSGEGPLVKEISDAQAAVEATPRDVDAWIALGQAWVQHARNAYDPGFFLNAEASAAIALGIAPGDRAALNLRGLVLLDAHRFEEAAALARQILAAHPKDPMALGTLSDAVLELGDVEAATRSVQAMLDIKPNLPSYSRASWLRWLSGDVEGALKLVRSAYDAGRSQRDPEPGAWVLVQAARIFWHKGDLEGAAAGLEMALKRVPGYPQALVEKGRVALARGDAAAAVTHLTGSWAARPLVETAGLLSEARARAGDAAGAEAAWKDAIALGEKTDALGLARLLAWKGERPSDAVALLEGERKKRGGVYMDDAWAWALYRAGRVEEARVASVRALGLGTPDAGVLYHAGAIAIAAGEIAEGRKLIERALATNPHFDVREAQEARALLNDGQGGAPAAQDRDPVSAL